MAVPDTDLKDMIFKKSFASAVAWLLGFVIPALAQNTIVAGEAKAAPSHHANPVLETLFSVLNNTALIALVGVVVFGLIWLVQRKNVVEETTVVTESGADTAGGTTPEPVANSAPTSEGANSSTAEGEVKTPESESAKTLTDDASEESKV